MNSGWPLINEPEWWVKLKGWAQESKKKTTDDSLTHATLDMLEQLSSPAEKLGGPGQAGDLRAGPGQPGHSSKVSTDMESICEAKALSDSPSLSPLSSGPSSQSRR